VKSVKAIDDAILVSSAPPPVWVQSASLVFYGDPGNVICDESSPPGAGFSSDVCRQWEESFESAQQGTSRKAVLRMGFALGRGGGALESLARLARLGLGGSSVTAASTSVGSTSMTSIA
jgi:NAD dependent epimerase/dehydratase family enzyme